MKHRFDDPLLLPGTRLDAAACLALAVRLLGTPGEAYVERRGVPCAVAEAAGVRYQHDFAGRPAVLVPVRDRSGALTAVHGRYLYNGRGENKMLTIGRKGGAISVLDGAARGPLVVVEGLFDSLSVAVCGYPAVATIGREVPWLPEAATGREVFVAFDATRPGEAEAAHLLARVPGALRLPPPPRRKDWNTALAKLGAAGVTHWLRASLHQ
jgi:hypothetical protein